MSLTLADAEATARQAAYALPARHLRESLQRNALAQLQFRERGKSELLWVKVTHAGPGGTYHGVLQNEPATLTGIRFGGAVTFEARHIFEIDRG